MKLLTFIKKIYIKIQISNIILIFYYLNINYKLHTTIQNILKISNNYLGLYVFK